MKETHVIAIRRNSPDFAPMPYSYADWFVGKLIQLGFDWEDSSPPHFRLVSGDIEIVVSPYPNVVTVVKHRRSFVTELYCHPSIPQDEPSFDAFFNNVKPLI